MDYVTFAIYTETESKSGILSRRGAIEFAAAGIAQLIQVELLQELQSLAQIQGASLLNF